MDLYGVIFRFIVLLYYCSTTTATLIIGLRFRFDDGNGNVRDASAVVADYMVTIYDEEGKSELKRLREARSKSTLDDQVYYERANKFVSTRKVTPNRPKVLALEIDEKMHAVAVGGSREVLRDFEALADQPSDEHDSIGAAILDIITKEKTEKAAIVYSDESNLFLAVSCADPRTNKILCLGGKEPKGINIVYEGLIAIGYQSHFVRESLSIYREAQPGFRPVRTYEELMNDIRAVMRRAFSSAYNRNELFISQEWNGFISVGNQLLPIGEKQIAQNDRPDNFDRSLYENNVHLDLLEQQLPSQQTLVANLYSKTRQMIAQMPQVHVPEQQIPTAPLAEHDDFDGGDDEFDERPEPSAPVHEDLQLLPSPPKEPPVPVPAAMEEEVRVPSKVPIPTPKLPPKADPTLLEKIGEMVDRLLTAKVPPKIAINPMMIRG